MVGRALGGLATLPGPGLGIGNSMHGSKAKGQHSQLGSDEQEGLGGLAILPGPGLRIGTICGKAEEVAW